MRAVHCLLALLALTGVAAFGGAEKQEVTQEVKAVVEKVRDAFDEAANAQGMNRMKGASRFEPVDVRAQFLRAGICACRIAAAPPLRLCKNSPAPPRRRAAAVTTASPPFPSSRRS